MTKLKKTMLGIISALMMISSMTIYAQEDISIEKEVISWSWSDDQNIKMIDDAYYIEVEKDAYDDITTILPQTINAETLDKEESITSESLVITWVYHHLIKN